jgi:uncharacterized membrane protein YdfJ with MMPL/SSD domain
MRRVVRLVEKHPVATLAVIVVVLVIAWLAFHIGLMEWMTA